MGVNGHSPSSILRGTLPGKKPTYTPAGNPKKLRFKWKMSFPVSIGATFLKVPEPLILRDVAILPKSPQNFIMFFRLFLGAPTATKPS